MGRYLLSPNAIRSINNIEEYSLANFGKKQTGIYLKKLQEKMQFTAENPKSGTLRTDIFNEWKCYSFPAESHTIYYEIVSYDEINIIDILHQSMEPRYHLTNK